MGAVVGIGKEAYVETSPTLDIQKIDDQAQTSFFYDAQGNLITDYKGTENRVMVSIAAMPTRLRNAFVAVEDARAFIPTMGWISSALSAPLSPTSFQAPSRAAPPLPSSSSGLVLTDEMSYNADTGSVFGHAA